MRLFIVSYQKSGTHQIMPVFDMIPDVVDRGHSSYINAPDRFSLNRWINWEGVEETVESLRKFKHNSNIAFGHVAYMPQYAKVLKETDTKVIFNIRDPRDVVVAEYMNARRQYERDPKSSPLWNFYDKEAEKFIFEKNDPIPDLITLASVRWPRWLGWLKHDFVKAIKYEDLRLNAYETAVEICSWVEGVHCPPPEQFVEKSRPKQGNPTFRKGEPGEWVEVFKPHHVELSEKLLKDIIKRMGYEE